MHLRLVVALGCLSTAIPLTSLFAQAQTSEIPNWSLSLGFDPRRLSLFAPQFDSDALVVGNLTRSWQSPNSKFARHISLLAGSDFPYRVGQENNDGCGGCTGPFSSRHVALTVGASYDLFRVSRFTPYVTTGTGAYYTKMSKNLDESVSQMVDHRHFRTGLSLGANAGLGLKARFGSREFFVEQLIHAIDLARPSRQLRPLNFGIRF